MTSFFVPGIPVPQGRPRAFKLGNTISMYDDPKSKAWKRVVAQVAALQHNRWCGENPLAVSLSFFMPRPKSAKIEWCDKRPDVDNLSKGILDALNGICFKDDGQVVALYAQKKYGTADYIGVHITIEDAK